MPGLNNNLSNAKDNTFALTIQQMKEVSFKCTRVTIPGVSVAETVNGTPNIDINSPTSKIAYETFACSFIVDEDWSNYKRVVGEFDKYQAGTDERFDFSVIVPNNHGKAGNSFNFVRAHFLTIDTIDLTSTTSRATDVICTMTIRFTRMNMQDN